jgi:cytochrome P450
MTEQSSAREPVEFKELVTGVRGANASDVYALCRATAPIFYSDTVNAWVLTRYDDVHRALNDEPVFGGPLQYGAQAGAAIHGRVLLQMSGDEHRKKTGLISGRMRSPQSLRGRMGTVINDLCRSLLDDIEPAPAYSDFRRTLVEPLPMGVITTLIDVDEATRFRNWYEAISAAGGGNPQGDVEVMQLGLKARDELYEFFAPLIRQRRANPGDDLLSDLCAMEYEGTQMTDEEIQAFMSFLLVAGVETTARVMGSLVKQLIMNPDQWALLVEDPTLATSAAAEIIRMRPPHHATKRQLQQDVELGGVELEAGAIVLAVMAAGNLDDNRFANGSSFDVTRFRSNANAQFVSAGAHMAFGGGRHYCTGSLLAKLEMVAAIEGLVERFSALEFVDDVVPDDVGWPLRGPAALPVRAIARG